MNRYDVVALAAAVLVVGPLVALVVGSTLVGLVLGTVRLSVAALRRLLGRRRGRAETPGSAEPVWWLGGYELARADASEAADGDEPARADASEAADDGLAGDGDDRERLTRLAG